MHRRWLRVPALCVLVALCLSFMPVSASAAGLDATRVYTSCSFWSWLNRTIFSGVYDAADALWGLGSDYYGGGRSTPYNGGGRPDADVQSAYNSYVSDLDSDYGTHSVNDSGIRLYPSYSTADVKKFDSFQIISSGNPFIASGSCSSAYYISNSMVYFAPLFRRITLPFSFNYSVHIDAILDNFNGSFDSAVRTSFSSGSSYTTDELKPYYYMQAVGSGSVNVHLYVDVAPVSGLITDYYPDAANISSVSRAPSVISSAFSHSSLSTRYHVGTKDSSGNIDAVFDTSFFDEQSKVFSDPASGRNVTITNWSYDYSTRSYALTDGTDNYTLTFGDDYVTTVVPDGNGGTVTTKYYYVVSEPVPTPATTDPTTGLPVPSSDNYQDDPTTTTGFWSKLWKAFKDGLAALIASIISAIFSGILALINGILGLFTGLLSGLGGLISGFFSGISQAISDITSTVDTGGFNGLLRSCLVLLPGAVKLSLLLACSVMVLFGVIRKL